MFAFSAQRPRRKPSLTPMIDVVFLLLVFFMLAARFGNDMAIPLHAAGPGGDYTGPPRLIGITQAGMTLNGVAVAPDALAAAVLRLTTAPDDIVILQPGPDARLQHLTDAMGILSAAGLTRLVLVE
jgi:biopolymer transport protein ExbD